MKESFKKKLVRSKAYMGCSCRKKMGDEKLAESRCPESGWKMDPRKTDIAMGDCITSDLERVGEEWKNYR